MSSNTSETAPTKSSFGKKLPYRLAVVGLGLVVLWFITSLGNGPLLKAGTQAPPWTLKEPNSNRRTLSLEELRGKVVVLDFWSLGCPICMNMMPELDAVAKEFEDKGVSVVSVSAWGESKYDVFRVKKKKKLSFHFLVGTQEVVTAYKVTSLPTLYIIDKDGEIAETHQGYISRKSLRKSILDVLDD